MPSEAKVQRSGQPVPLWRYAVVIVLLAACAPLMKRAERVQSGFTYSAVGLRQLPKHVDGWTTTRDNDLDKLSLDQLTPDDYVSRTYVSADGLPLDFLVVYGHLKQTFHSPGFCLPGGGFEILDKTEEPVNSTGLPIQMNLFKMQRKDTHWVVLYCFVQGDNVSTNLFAHNWNLLRAHFRGQRATGALVRVILPSYPNDEVAIARAKDFIRQIYPDVRKRIG